jgi:hypothetical protein
LQSTCGDVFFALNCFAFACVRFSSADATHGRGEYLFSSLKTTEGGAFRGGVVSFSLSELLHAKRR